MSGLYGGAGERERGLEWISRSTPVRQCVEETTFNSADCTEVMIALPAERGGSIVNGRPSSGQRSGRRDGERLGS